MDEWVVVIPPWWIAGVNFVQIKTAHQNKRSFFQLDFQWKWWHELKSGPGLFELAYHIQQSPLLWRFQDMTTGNTGNSQLLIQVTIMVLTWFRIWFLVWLNYETLLFGSKPNTFFFDMIAPNIVVKVCKGVFTVRSFKFSHWTITKTEHQTILPLELPT